MQQEESVLCYLSLLTINPLGVRNRTVDLKRKYQYNEIVYLIYSKFAHWHDFIMSTEHYLERKL